MKKFIVTILSILYITSVTGATIHFHYCMGKLVEWGFWKNNSEKCGNCGMEKKAGENDGCCKDEHKRVKLDKDHKITESVFQIINSASSATLNTSFVQLPDIHIISVSEKNPVSHAPPRSCGVAVYILNRTFLI